MNVKELTKHHQAHITHTSQRTEHVYNHKTLARTTTTQSRPWEEEGGRGGVG